MKRYIRAAKSTHLYHGTTWKNAIAILETNELRANVSNETETYGVSFTRNKREAYDSVCFVVDQLLLSYNYKIEPVYRDGIAGRDLAEERVDRTIKNFRKYIIEARVNDPFTVRILRKKLSKSSDPALLTDPNLNRWNEVYWVNKFIETADKYNIHLDNDFEKCREMIQAWKDTNLK